MIGILTDVTKCTGCFNCVRACAKAHRLPRYVPSPKDRPDGLSQHRWTTIIERPGRYHVRKHCQHCLEPACVSACPVGAMHKTPEGAVVYDPTICMGCRYCLMACPFGVPAYDWHSPVPYVRKCNLCYERITAEHLPACVEACPEKATIFGEREELLAEAHRRIAAYPNHYVPRVYGEREVGGTSVVYVSPIGLEFLASGGKPGENPMPDLTWGVLSQTPVIALGMVGLMVGTRWVIERRMQHQREGGQGEKGEGDG